MSIKIKGLLLLFLLFGLKPLPSIAGNMEIKEIMLSLPRKDYSTVTLDNMVFFAGGRTNTLAVDTVDIYEADKDKWSRASLSEPRYLPTTITLDNEVFFGGGYLDQESYSKTVDIYNKQKKEWTSFELSQARSFMTVCTTQNKIFFVGGRIGSKNSNVVDIYDVTQGTLEQTSLSQARYYPTVAKINDNTILFAGGYLKENQFSDVIDIYTLDTKQWKSIRLSQAKNHLSVIPVADKVVITGRDHDKSSTQAAINIFKISSITKLNKHSDNQNVLIDNDAILSDLQDEIVQEIVNEAPILSIKKQIYKQIGIFKNESLEESISKLYEVESYYWPGAKHSGFFNPAFPLGPDIGQLDIDRIMSNRRFLKVYQEMSYISKKEADILLNKEIRRSLSEYQTLFEEYMLKNKPYFDSLKSGRIPDSGPVYQISNRKDGSPTLAGIRLKVLSLVLLAGNLKLDGTQEVVKEVTANAVKRKEQLYMDPFSNSNVSTDLLVNAGLYNRQILITGILGTTFSAEKEKQFLEHMNCYKQKKTLTHFNANATEYDLHSEKQGGPTPIDYSEGTIEIEYIEPIDDSTFELMLKHPEISIK